MILGFLLVFVHSLLAATLIPIASEPTLLFMINQYGQEHGFWLVATLGNTLGGALMFYLGWWAVLKANESVSTSDVSIKKRSMLTAWVHNIPKPDATQHNWVNKWGGFALLLAWVPVIGDPICIAAGWLRVNVWLSMCCLLIGKALRYGVVIFAWQLW